MNLKPEDTIANYPMLVKMNGVDYTIRTMTVDDGQAMLEFATALPAHDILFM